MARKTNKTTHVLNLLTNGTEAEGTQNVQETEAGAASEAPKGAADNKVIVVNETSENEKLSNEIKNRLEAQLEAEVAEAAPQTEAAEPDIEEAEEETAAESEAEAEPAEEEKTDSPKRAYRMMNVMERLLANMEPEMEDEMRQYGVCMCDRCRADVQALVLTKMPAKYVIVDSTNASPIVGYYEGRYKTAMFTEILKACVTVKEKPRH
ncbi:MAG: late competence development ComFB family protein [Lachnospiraceae bacterium]|nr:late competence development ComFB family protein [Lachnospiraceae bacterium]